MFRNAFIFLFTLPLGILSLNLAIANPLYAFMNKKTGQHLKVAAETFGPATFTCYYRLAGGDMTPGRLEYVLMSNEMKECLIKEAKEEAEFIEQKYYQAQGYIPK